MAGLRYGDALGECADCAVLDVFAEGWASSAAEGICDGSGYGVVGFWELLAIGIVTSVKVVKE